MAPPIVFAIPILAIIFGLSLAMLALYLGYRRRRETFALYHQERMAALEKGVELTPLPDALVSDSGGPFRSHHPRGYLLKGMIWLFSGIGLLVALGRVADWDVALFALIPIGVGLAQLIYYFIEAKKETAALANGPAVPAKADA